MACVSLRTALGDYLPFLLLTHSWLAAVVRQLTLHCFLSVFYSFLHFFLFPFLFLSSFSTTSRMILLMRMEAKRTVFHSQSKRSFPKVRNLNTHSFLSLLHLFWAIFIDTQGFPAALNRRCQNAERQLYGGLLGPLYKLRESNFNSLSNKQNSLLELVIDKKQCL